MFFVVDIPNSGQDVLEIMVNKPNRERQKLMREQNILKQVGPSRHHSPGALSPGLDRAPPPHSPDLDLQAAAGALHRQRGRTHAEAGGAGRPAPRPLQAHLSTVLPRPSPLSAGLP